MDWRWNYFVHYFPNSFCALCPSLIHFFYTNSRQVITTQHLAHCDVLLAQWISTSAVSSNPVNIKNKQTIQQSPDFISKNMVQMIQPISRICYQLPWWAEKSDVLIGLSLLESSGVRGKIASMVKPTQVLVWYMGSEAQESVFNKNSRWL